MKRRAIAAGTSAQIYCHTFQSTGITAYLGPDGTAETAQQIAADQSLNMSKLYGGKWDLIKLDEIERIAN